MNLSNIMMILALGGLAIGLLMRFNGIVREKLKLDSPYINKKYINYKINFLIIISIALIILEIIGTYNKALESKLDIIMSALLLTSITVDMVIRRRISKGQK